MQARSPLLKFRCHGPFPEESTQPAVSPLLLETSTSLVSRRLPVVSILSPGLSPVSQRLPAGKS